MGRVLTETNSPEPPNEAEAKRIISEPLGIARLAEQPPAERIILAAHSEAQAERLFAAACVLAGALRPVLLPGWDCLRYDRSSPSRAVMGHRMQTLRALAEDGPHLLIASVDSLAQRLPPADKVVTAVVTLGQTLDRDAFRAELERMGYAIEDEADQAGETAFRDAVIDLVPANHAPAVRIRLDGDTVAEIDRFDPATQRSGGTLDRIVIGPASEVVTRAGEARPPGLEHWLPDYAGPLASVFDLMPGAILLLDPDSGECMTEALEQIVEARATRVALCRATGGALPPESFYLTVAEWTDAQAAHDAQTIDWLEADAPPRLRALPDPTGQAEAFIESVVADGARVGLSGRRLARALDLKAESVDDWPGLLALPPGSVGVLPAGLGLGFVTPGATVLASVDVLPPRHGEADHQGLFAMALRPGDTVIHLDYGMAQLDGIETVCTKIGADEGETDVLCLNFAGDARKLVPCAEMDRVWRYGAAADVALDRADGSTWIKRRVPVLVGLSHTAESLVAAAREREGITAPVIQPPRRRMDRFVAGFPYKPTPDQQMAFDAIAADLASDKPMDRLLCGDVGFGKTEAALRAAAAVALAGKQVAILAPTTVLVRQHLATFQRRFAAIGVQVAALSRLTRPADVRSIREGLASGKLHVVIGTQALAGPDIAFADLALTIVDEEQRFGTKDKTALTRLRERGVHSLTLSATPIPRTLEGALAGLHTLSVLTTPPARRQPVRTAVIPLDEAVLKTALLREHARGGQSFCVCPRVADLDDVANLLDRIAPDLSVVILHGKMKPEAVDSTLVGFSEGHGDVLLATDIIEAGLDIPRANTILVWHADQFGLAQLHQLRGRVGRGRARGMAWLFTDPTSPPTEAAVERLDALAAHDGLGAGFAIAARDLDLRGAGDLIGEEQAGHVKLLGVELARHLLGQALARARGELVVDEWRPEMRLNLPGHIPEAYMPDPAARIALYARLVRPHHTQALAEELEDRFGPLPDPVRFLLEQASLRAASIRLGVAKLEVGPLAIAADLRAPAPEIDGLERKGKRLLLRQKTASPDERLAAARMLLRALAQGGQPKRQAAA